MQEARNTEKSKMAPRMGFILGIALGLIGAVVVSRVDWRGGIPQPPWTADERSASDTSAAALERLADALEAEVQARAELAERIEKLEIEISRLRGIDREATTSALGLRESKDEAEVQPGLDPSAESSGFDDEALIARGTHPRDVALLRDLWENHELERAAIADRALREGWFMQDRHRNELNQLDRELREDLEDEEYDRYLYALGEPNRLKASDVLQGSSASDAGLQRGDFILRYDDVRVFKPGELLLASSRGVPGESVAVVILRDGITRTVHVSRGPLGVMIEHSRGDPLPD